MKLIALKDLQKLEACSKQIELFRKTFGDSAEVTPANIRKAKKAGLDLAWVAFNFPELKISFTQTRPCGCKEKYLKGVLVKVWPSPEHFDVYNFYAGYARVEIVPPKQPK